MLSIPLDFPDRVMEHAQKCAAPLRKMCGYLQPVGDEIVLRVFSFRQHKRKPLEITEVARKITGCNTVLTKNLYSGGMNGYHAVYEAKDKLVTSHGYPFVAFHASEFDKWYEADTFGTYATIINVDVLQETRFKYCGYSQHVTDDIIGFLNAYDKHPAVEFFGKLGIKPTPMLIKKAEKDKAFRKWLFKTDIDVHCGAKTIIYAYEHDIPIEEAKRIVSDICYMQRHIKEVTKTGICLENAVKYLRENKIPYRSYNDYLKAIKKLGLDLSDTKNVFPRDFQRMHDLRIAEYDSVMAKEDKEKRKAFHKKFETTAKEAKKFEYRNEAFAAIIPSQVQDLVAEGRELHHCVGQMGYDKKMADGKVLIVFIRNINNINKPLATVEYGIESKKILQAHTLHNGSPDKECNDFIETWAKRTTKMIGETA